MSYLLRTEIDYRLCYGKPEYKYVVAPSGSFFSEVEYIKMIGEEKEESAYNTLSDYVVSHGWADICQNDFGLVISDDIAGYLLDGEFMDENSFMEITRIWPAPVNRE